LLISRVTAEFVGTFMILFLGFLAIATHSGNAIVGLIFGAAVTSMIYALGAISGAHFNPAVSLAFRLLRKLTNLEFIFYVIAQCTAAICASFLVGILVPSGLSLAVTTMKIAIAPAFLAELTITTILILVILQSASESNNHRAFAGLAIGLTVAAAAISAGPLTGAAMNPVRSLGPALTTGDFQNLWLYLTAPLAAALPAVIIYKILKSQIRILS